MVPFINPLLEYTMKIEVQASGLSCDQDLQHFVKLRTDHALYALRDQIGAINVFIDGTDSTEHQDQIRCLVVINLRTEPDLLVEHRHSNVYIAIHQAIDEAGWKLAEALSSRQLRLIDKQMRLLKQPATPEDKKFAPGHAA